MRLIFLSIAFAVGLLLVSFKSSNIDSAAPQDSIHYSREKHFKNVRQLTFGGDNAEA
ncbi:MAG: hypothetical protein ACKOE6_14135 [Flammeovirgaceae bacterium]